MAQKKKPKISTKGSKSIIHFDSLRKFAGPNPARTLPGAGQHGGTVEQKKRRDRQQNKRDLKKWED